MSSQCLDPWNKARAVAASNAYIFKLSGKDKDQQSVSAGNCVYLGFCFNLSYGKGIMSLSEQYVRTFSYTEKQDLLGESEKCGSCAQLPAHLGRPSQSSKKVYRQGVSSKCVTTRRWDSKPSSATRRVCMASARFRMQQGCSVSSFFL